VIREVLARADLTLWPVVGLIFFVTAFVAAAVWLWVLRRDTDWEAVGNLPLGAGEIVADKENHP
jgi:hypothetical protein